MRGPALSNLDLALFKNFQVKERLKLQFRAEFFNSLNHTVLGNPNTTLTNATFGRSCQPRRRREWASSD